MGYHIHILNHNSVPEPALGSLVHQWSHMESDDRIIIWDDGSDSEIRSKLDHLQKFYEDHHFIQWNLRSKNVGRAAMRQQILENTREGWNISMDGDMMPDDDFLKTFKNALTDPKSIYKGQHYYEDSPPSRPYLLHWNYGKKREVTAQTKNSYHHFSTGIFAWHHSTVHHLSFYQELRGYGHEDTLFGLKLKEKGIPVMTIPAKAIHLGLQEHQIFISKQIEAISQLKIILKKYPAYSSRLTKWGKRIRQFEILRTYLIKDCFREFCERNLEDHPQQLLYLDLLKLHYYLKKE